MSVISDFEKWQRHYTAMLNGKVALNQKVILLNNSESQVGKGLTIVSPSEQQDMRLRAIVKKKLKTKTRSNISHSSAKRRRTRKNSRKTPKTSSKKTKKSSSYKRK